VIAVGQNPGIDGEKLSISLMSGVIKTMGIREIDREVWSWLGLTLLYPAGDLMLALLKLRILISEDRLVKLASLLLNKTQKAVYCA
jgi:hypothetical protein